MRHGAAVGRRDDAAACGSPADGPRLRGGPPLRRRARARARRERVLNVEALVVEAASAAHREGLFALFEAAESRCFCRWFHFQGDKNEWLETLAFRPEENRAWLARGLEEAAASARGLVALTGGGEVVGWLKLLPRHAGEKVYGQRYYRALEAAKRVGPETAHLSCALVHPSFRRAGVLTKLIAAAIELAPGMGFSELLAFPRSTHGESVSDAALFTLPTAALLAAGFAVVEGDEPYPVVRRLAVTT